MTELLCAFAMFYIYGMIRYLIESFQTEGKATLTVMACSIVWPFVPPFAAIVLGLNK